jgi:hypothetical protein
MCAIQDKNRKWGYIDETGEIVIDTDYDMATKFQDGLALVQEDGFISL